MIVEINLYYCNNYYNKKLFNFNFLEITNKFFIKILLYLLLPCFKRGSKIIKYIIIIISFKNSSSKTNGKERF